MPTGTTRPTRTTPAAELATERSARTSAGRATKELRGLNIGILVPETGYHGHVRLITSTTAYVDGFFMSSTPLVLSLDLAEAHLPTSPTSVEVEKVLWQQLTIGTLVSINDGRLLIERIEPFGHAEHIERIDPTGHAKPSGHAEHSEHAKPTQPTRSPTLDVTLCLRTQVKPTPITTLKQTYADSAMAIALHAVIDQLRESGGQALFDATLRLHDRMEPFLAAFHSALGVSSLHSPASRPTGFKNPSIEIEQALRRLVGFGLGLTPSGDDALVGFLVAIRTIGNAQVQTQARAQTIGTMLLSLLSTTPNITTFVSAQMLRSTIAGCTSQATNQLLSAMIEVVRSNTDTLLIDHISSGSQRAKAPCHQPELTRPSQTLQHWHEDQHPTHVHSRGLTHSSQTPVPQHWPADRPLTNQAHSTEPVQLGKSKLHTAVLELLSFGASSGADTLVGILAACNVVHAGWSKE